MVEKEGKVIDVMENIILLKNVWLKRRERKMNFEENGIKRGLKV
nr:hypothetical protein [Sphingobacterium bovisgrunnientis]